MSNPTSLRANLYRAVRRGTLWKSLIGQEPFSWVRHEPGVVEFGSRYGRWAVETRNLSPATQLISFGLGDDVSFELALMQRFGCVVTGFDPTPAAVDHMRRLQHVAGLTWHAYALFTHDGRVEFQLPPVEAADQVSASATAVYSGSQSVTVPCLTLRGALKMCSVERPDIIKLDIEGAEYDVLNMALDEGALTGTSQLLVEFHHFLPGMQASQTRQMIGRLQATGLRIAWVGRTNHEHLFVRS